jgi:hypothetical protein
MAISLIDWILSGWLLGLALLAALPTAIFWVVEFRHLFRPLH